MADSEVKDKNSESVRSAEIGEAEEEINVDDDTANSVHKCLLVIDEVLEKILKKLKWRDLLNCSDVCSLWRIYAVEIIEKQFKFNYGVCIQVNPKCPIPLTEPDTTRTDPIPLIHTEYLKNFRLKYPDAGIGSANEVTLASILLKLTSMEPNDKIRFRRLNFDTCKEICKLTDIDTNFQDCTLEMVLMPWHCETVGFNRDGQEKEVEILNHSNEMNLNKFLATPLCILNGIKLTSSARTIIPYLPYILRGISPSCKIIIRISLDWSENYESPSSESLVDAHSWNLNNLVLMLQLNEDGHQRIFDDIANILPNLQTLELCGEEVDQLIYFVVQGRRLGQNLRKLTIHGNIYNVYNIFTESNVLPKLQELHIRNGSVCCQEKQGRSDRPIIFKALINLKYLTHLSLPLIGHSKQEGCWYEYWLGPDFEDIWPWPYLDNLKFTNGQCCGPPSSDLNLLKSKRPNLNLEYGSCVNVKCNTCMRM